MKIITLLLSSTILLNASYEKLENYYESHQYQKAINEAKASKSEYSNPKLHLLWAKSAEALGKTKEAMAAYERVAILDEEDSESRVSLLSIYHETSRDELADDMSTALDSYQLTPQQRNSLGLLVQKDINTLKVQVSASVGYDTNINVSASLDDLAAYYPTVTNQGELSSLFARVLGSVSYVNELGDKGGWYLRGDLNLYYQNNFDASYYNLFDGGVSAGVGCAGSSYTLYLPVSYDHVNYLEVSLLDQVSLAPTLNMKLTNTLIISVNANYTLRTYSEAVYEGMGDTSLGGRLGHYYLFDKDYVYANIKFENFTSSEKVHYAFIDKQMMTFSLGTNLNLTQWLTLRADYRYRKGEYSDASDFRTANVSEKRSDDYNQIELKFSHYFNGTMELYISNRYINNSSNYIPAQYSKNITMLGLSLNY